MFRFMLRECKIWIFLGVIFGRFILLMSDIHVHAAATTDMGGSGGGGVVGVGSSSPSIITNFKDG